MAIIYWAFIMCQDLCEIFYVHLLKSQTTLKSSHKPSQFYRQGTQSESIIPLCKWQKQHESPNITKPKPMVLTISFLFFNKNFTMKLFPKTFMLRFVTWYQDISAIRSPGNWFLKLRFKHPGCVIRLPARIERGDGLVLLELCSDNLWDLTQTWGMQLGVLHINDPFARGFTHMDLLKCFTKPK